jgi:type I restriction enzyme S subunit
MKFIEKKLEELYTVKDGTHDSPKYVTSVNGFPLITSKNLKNGYIDISNVDYISIEDYNKINSRSNVDFGDLLMPMIGSIGNPVLVNISPEFAIKNVALFKKNEEANSLEYLRHILNSSYFKKKLANDSKGGTQKFVSLGYLRKLTILIPEKIEDQIRIAEILTQAENLITQRKESIGLLDELLKSTFLEMFGDLDMQIKCGVLVKRHFYNYLFDY